MLSSQKQPSCEKGATLRTLVKKSYESKLGGGQQMAVMILMQINSYTMATRDLPDIYAQARGPQAYISGKSQVAMV